MKIGWILAGVAAAVAVGVVVYEERKSAAAPANPPVKTPSPVKQPPSPHQTPSQSIAVDQPGALIVPAVVGGPLTLTVSQGAGISSVSVASGNPGIAPPIPYGAMMPSVLVTLSGQPGTFGVIYYDVSGNSHQVTVSVA